jgi:hypothetical protein
MAKKGLIALILIVIGAAAAFAEIISFEDYEAASSIPVNRTNAQELLWRVNNLLEKVGAYHVTVTSGARDSGGAQTHRLSNAIDLRWDASLYERLKNNISGSGLRLELIEGIRNLGQTDHIHLDIVDARGGRTFLP